LKARKTLPVHPHFFVERKTCKKGKCVKKAEININSLKDLQYPHWWKKSAHKIITANSRRAENKKPGQESPLMNGLLFGDGADSCLCRRASTFPNNI
jgi:hypothetical protein